MTEPTPSNHSQAVELVDSFGRVWVQRDPTLGRVAVALGEDDLAALADYARHQGRVADQTRFDTIRNDLLWSVCSFSESRIPVRLIDREERDELGRQWILVASLPSLVFAEPAAAVVLGASGLRHLADGWSEMADAARDAGETDAMRSFAARSLNFRGVAYIANPQLALQDGCPPHRGTVGNT